MAESRENSVQVVAKVGALLDALGRSGEASASELAETLGEPRSSVYRLLSSLQQLDLIEPGGSRGSYRLGLGLVRLGNAVVERLDARAAALPVMERIHDATGETLFLCVRRGRDAVCIERLDGRGVTSLALRLGGSLPLHSGAAPRALLAWEPREAWEAYIASGPLERFSERTPVTREAVIAKLEEALARGVAVSDEDVTPAIAALGAPVFDHRGKVCAALSISGHRPSIVGDRAGDAEQLIIDGAAEISRALGHDEQRMAAGGRRAAKR